MSKTQEKAILINAIIGFIGSNIAKVNKQLASENLHEKQTAFDAGDWFFRLAFMDDSDIKKIAGLIL